MPDETRDENADTPEEWMQAWDEAIAAVGTDYSGGATQEAIDEIERGAVRKFCEPLEFDCPLHYDEEVAKAHGYRGIMAPLSGVSMTWTDPGLWGPGVETRYPEPDPDIDIVRATRTEEPPPFPPTSTGFATDIEIEYFEPPCVGDRLTFSGRRLTQVLPRETSVGRGAFMIWEREVHNQRGELVAKVRNGGYLYDPHT